MKKSMNMDKKNITDQNASSESDKKIILEAKHVTRRFPASKGRTVLANNDVNLCLYEGETLGIVGESGCGKSTFINMLASLDKPTEGEILFMGKDLGKLKGKELREHRKHIQMVFQDPSAAFSPRIKIQNILCESLLNYKLITKREVHDKAVELLKMVELSPDFAERYPHNMSGGQRQRVGIARSLALEPEVLICDEATSALDVSVQEKVVDLLLRLQKEKNISMVFICHDIALARIISHRVAVMYLGNIVEIVKGKDLCQGTMHPYTEALSKAIFSTDMDFNKTIESIESEAPSPLNVPPGCPFQNRCDYCKDICKTEKPILKKIGDDHEIACHLF